METTASYGELANVRETCLLPHSDWTEPTPEEVRTVMKLANWTGEEFARRIGVEGRTVRRWTAGDKPINYTAWCVLCVQAGLGQVWTYSPQ